MEVRQLNKLQLKVAIVDDDRNFGFWLQQQLTNLPCRVTTYVLAPVAGLVDTIQDLEPDIVFTEIHLSSISATGVIRTLRERSTSGNIIALSEQPDEVAALEAFRAGAVGFLDKQKVHPQDISRAVLEVLSGGATVSSALLRQIVEKLYSKRETPRDVEGTVSPREREILQLLNKGYSSKDISDTLFISYHTVRTHLKNIYKKLGVSSITEAMAKTKHRAP